VHALSTVLEQDHFCSDFLDSHVTAMTNSENHDDAARRSLAAKRRAALHQDHYWSQVRVSTWMKKAVAHRNV